MSDNSPDDMLRLIDRTVHKYGPALPAMEYTPLHALLAMEDDELPGDELEIRREERRETFVKMIDFIFQGGPEPLTVLRNLFAIVKAVRPGVIGNMTMDDIAIICADGGKATVSARITNLYNKKLGEAGCHAKASCQKRGNYSAPQMGNKNRKGKK